MCIKCTNTFNFAANKPIFCELNADEVNAGSIEATEVESLFMECGKTVSAQMYTV